MTRLKNHQKSETYTPPATLTTEGGIGNKRASYVAPAGQGVPPIPSADDGTSVFDKKNNKLFSRSYSFSSSATHI